MVIDKLMSLHGLHAPKTNVNLNHNHHSGEIVHKKDMKRLSDDDLMRIAGRTLDALEPELVDYQEADFEEIKE